MIKNLIASAFCILPLCAEELPALKATAAAAEKFLTSLNAAQKTKASFPFANDERENFRYTPRERAGVPLKEMNEAQRQTAMDLLSSALSEKGKLKAEQIIKLESILAEIEQKPDYRDAGKYFVSIFGTPGDAKGWGWRFEGHHLSINITIVDGKTSVTPHFIGTNPAEVKEGPHKGLRVLAAEEDLARKLVTSLVEGGKKEVIFSDKAPDEILTGEKRKIEALTSVGITTAEMSPDQRKLLFKLITQYSGRYRPEIAKTDMAKIIKAGIGQVYFGWSGSIKPGEGYYYRIQGPTFLMEAVNTRNNANHIHATWRDLKSDFGRDLLGEHLKHDH